MCFFAPLLSRCHHRFHCCSRTVGVCCIYSSSCTQQPEANDLRRTSNTHTHTRLKSHSHTTEVSLLHPPSVAESVVVMPGIHSFLMSAIQIFLKHLFIKGHIFKPFQYMCSPGRLSSIIHLKRKSFFIIMLGSHQCAFYSSVNHHLTLSNTAFCC